MNAASITVIIGRLLVAAICAVAAGYLAIEGKDGWGWFLFIVVILGTITVSEKRDGSTEVAE